MTGQTLTDFSQPATEAAALRSLAYATFAAAYEYPDEEYLQAIRAGTLADKLRELLSAINFQLVEGADWQALRDAGADDDALQIEFTRLFDVGGSSPPCALYGGLYTGARMKTMEELVRFYNFFGLSMSETPHELPDHLTTQLEFLHFLAFQESGLAEEGGDVSDCRRAERDFVARHPGRWVPQLLTKLAEHKAMNFFQELTRLLDGFLTLERQMLVAEQGEVAPEQESQFVDVINI
jgi:DMSO reductase family type II enzyme chaperone